MNRHAYLVMAHENFDLLARLLSHLDHPRNDFYVHIDATAVGVDFEALSSALTESSITFVKRRDLRWGHFSLVQCALDLMETAGTDYAYLHLISGADVPLKSPDEVLDHFDNGGSREFVHFAPQEEWERVTFRAAYFHPFQRFARPRNLLSRLLSRGALDAQKLLRVNRWRGVSETLAYGSQWFSITGEFAEYLLARRLWINQRFRYSLCGDELAFQTILLASPFAHRAADSNLRLIDWERSNGVSPYVWRECDIDQLKDSSMLFARKFDPAIDSAVIDALLDTPRPHRATSEPTVNSDTAP